MGRSIQPLQQLPHGLIENRIAPQRQHITHGKHITHDNQHINKQHEHQPIGEAMTNHHAEDGDKKSILDARIERAYANEYDAAFAAAQSTTDDEEQTALYKQCLKILSDTAANVYLQDMADFVAMDPALEGYEFYPLYVIDMAKLYFAA